jgi:hypothetical protein
MPTKAHWYNTAFTPVSSRRLRRDGRDGGVPLGGTGGRAAGLPRRAHDSAMSVGRPQRFSHFSLPEVEVRSGRNP